MTYKPYGVSQLTGVMLGMREWLPLPGFAGGMPGANTEFAIRRADGRREGVSGHASGLVVKDDEIFEFRLGCGGGFGDPLERQPSSVARDVAQGRFGAQEAADIYGVVLTADGLADETATPRRRADLLAARLRRATPPAKSLSTVRLLAQPSAGGAPLYPGIEQHGDIAYASASGAALARAPDQWTDGCPVIDELCGERLVIRYYLDPLTGRFLWVDALPRGEPRTMHISPKRWLEAAKKTSAAA
jgi:N-methylhydantoinase B